MRQNQSSYDYWLRLPAALCSPCLWLIFLFFLVNAYPFFARGFPLSLCVFVVHS